jgi:hypothetical protein
MTHDTFQCIIVEDGSIGDISLWFFDSLWDIEIILPEHVTREGKIFESNIIFFASHFCLEFCANSFFILLWDWISNIYRDIAVW